MDCGELAGECSQTSRLQPSFNGEALMRRQNALPLCFVPVPYHVDVVSFVLVYIYIRHKRAACCIVTILKRLNLYVDWLILLPCYV